MITCTLGEKKYTVDFVSGRALREMEPASKMYGRLVRLSQDATEGKDVSQEQLTVTDALDTMVKWFCILFNNQFTPDEVYDNWSGDNGALKVHSKTTTGATVIVGGNFNTSRAIDWIAIGV